MKKALIILSLFFLLTSIALPAKVGGVFLPEFMRSGKTVLFLNGTGVRKKFWFKIYAMGLYLKKKSNNAQEILNADEPMAIRMNFIYNGVSAKKMRNAWNEGFEKSTHGNIAPIKDKIAKFNSLFNVEVKKGYVYDLIYSPEKGTSVYLNGKLLGTIKGLDFKKALFGIWIGDKPINKGLKKKLLGLD